MKEQSRHNSIAAEGTEKPRWPNNPLASVNNNYNDESDPILLTCLNSEVPNSPPKAITCNMTEPPGMKLRLASGIQVHSSLQKLSASIRFPGLGADDKTGGKNGLLRDGSNVI